MKSGTIQRKLIFLNVGWMGRYEGLNGDTIQGGGSFVREQGYGHEIFNFLPWQGKMYGYAETKRVNLERLGARPNADSVRGVLAIWVARNPYVGGTYIVGWYDNATLYREHGEPTSAANRKIEEYIGTRVKAVPQDIGRYAFYIVSAAAEDCQLIPTAERTFRIPRRGKGNMGQRNIWYADATNKTDFRKKVTDYVRARQNEKYASRIATLSTRKYGIGGEGDLHKSLKEWCANNPQELGLTDVLRIPGEMEHPFRCGDVADVVFQMSGGRYAVLEVETTDAETGAYQVLKYRTLLCAEKLLPIDSDQVTAILVAWQVPPSVRAFCDRYMIRHFEKIVTKHPQI